MQASTNNILVAKRVTLTNRKTPYQTPYQTLTSVNKVDQDKFKTSDLKTVTKYWDKVFLQNTVSEGIYDAIAGMSANAGAKGERESVSVHSTF